MKDTVCFAIIHHNNHSFPELIPTVENKAFDIYIF